MTDFKIGDKIAAAVRSGNNNPALRIGRIERIHERTYSIGSRRFTIRNADGKTTIVSEDRSVRIEADEHHTMDELYEYRMLYNAHTAKRYQEMYEGVEGGDRAMKSWLHHDGQPPFDKPLGTWFIVCLRTAYGQVTNHYKGEHWDLFDIPEAERAPEWDGHSPAVAAERLRRCLLVGAL